MKLIDALRIANRRQEGPDFDVLLACGFTPLHLEIAVKAHLKLALPDRRIGIRTGLYGDVAATLENNDSALDAAVIALEWADLDPRLGWRSMALVTDAIIADARARLQRISKAIENLASRVPVSLSLPTLPLPPVFHAPATELPRIQASLLELVYAMAASTTATVVVPATPQTSRNHDLRGELTTGFPYSFALAEEVALVLVRAILPTAAKKGLITDLDETLWKGVLGDDGVQGITWDLDHHSQFHTLYQVLLNALAERGTLIGVASKNDPDLVEQAFKRADLVLKPDNVFPVEAHWMPKTEPIRRILEIWNVNEDSVVFVDDNPLELEQIKRAFPAMESLQFRKDDPTFLSDLSNMFAKREVLDEDRLRTTSLRASQTLREATTNATLDDLLAGAEAKIVASWGKKPTNGRAFDLINKTNQFNLNGIRFTDADWTQFLQDPATHLLVVEYEDRFGKLGKIAVLGGRADDDGFAVTTWVMSCRAFSRRIEHQCLNLLFQRWNHVNMHFQPTQRNGPFSDFLSQIGGNSNPLTRREFENRCPRLFHVVEERVNG